MTRPDGRPEGPQWHGGLPSAWPSAWPSLAARVAMGCFVPVVAALVALGVVAVAGVVGSAWWVPLLPLVFLVGPLTLPTRVRAGIQRASNAKRLVVTVAPLGLLVRTPDRSRFVRPAAEVPTGGPVRYSLT